jgi:hypothetical protein
MAQKTWKHFACKCLSGLLALQTASCGTILYPERRGQPAGYLDPAVVALDAVGLVVFFIPGIIAFAVDFSNGTIYLPHERTSFSSPPDSQHLHTVQLNPAELTPQRLEAILHDQTGQPVSLEPGTYRAMRISQIQDFTPKTLDSLQSANATRVVFRGTAE